jgi:hypothetical protein
MEIEITQTMVDAVKEELCAEGCSDCVKDALTAFLMLPEVEEALGGKRVPIEPPVGSSFRDVEGDVWTRYTADKEGWRILPGGMRYTWREVLEWGPLTPCEGRND